MTIPTADCTSLNLAQAVMVLAYETVHRPEPQAPLRARLANTQEMESMYDMLQETLLKINFIPHKDPVPLDVQRPAPLLPPRPSGPGGPGDQGHLPSD